MLELHLFLSGILSGEVGDKFELLYCLIAFDDDRLMIIYVFSVFSIVIHLNFSFFAIETLISGIFLLFGLFSMTIYCVGSECHLLKSRTHTEPSDPLAPSLSPREFQQISKKPPVPRYEWTSSPEFVDQM